MLRTIATLVAAGLVLGAGGTAASADETDVKIFGYEPGDARAAACFVRVYDEAHLKAHPQQNVTTMTMLVDGEPDDAGRYYALSLGVTFRGSDSQMRASGGCGATADGVELISCGIDCDGGTIGLRFRDAGSILVDIPDGARTWDPDAPEDEEEFVDTVGRFGPDDKVFRLDRADPSQCVSLSYDDALTALLTKAH